MDLNDYFSNVPPSEEPKPDTGTGTGETQPQQDASTEDNVSFSSYAAQYFADEEPAPAGEPQPAQETPAPEPQPAQETPAAPEKKAKKEKTIKQQLTSFGVVMVVLCFLLSFLAGAGGAFAVMSFYPLMNIGNKNDTTEITEGNVHEIPVPSQETTLPDVTTQPVQESTTVSVTETQPPETTTAAPVAAAKTKGEIYADAVNSIVGIRAVVEQQVATFFGRYVTQTATSSGSGFFITADGYVVTNYHVVNGAKEITVTTYDGGSYPATVRGYEESNDIAVLKIEGSFTPAAIGRSADLRVGDDILVIGNPLGSLSYTFTDGVVSYLNRMITDETGTTIHMFQTNAAINEGNSGGPVYDMNGKVVGIASAKYASSSIEGLGFCIPIDDVIGMINDIMDTGYVTGKPVLGVSVQTVTNTMAIRYGISTGCYVVEIGDGTAADNAGILAADVITAIDDTVIYSATDMSSALSGKTAGDTVSVRVNRSGTDMIFTVTLDEYVPGAARTEYSNVYDF